VSRKPFNIAKPYHPRYNCHNHERR
jgi:hypothetical protein